MGVVLKPFSSLNSPGLGRPCCHRCNNFCFSHWNHLCLAVGIWDEESTCIGLGKCFGWPWSKVMIMAVAIGYWANYVTLPFDHTHDLGLGFSRSKFEIALSQEWEVWLTWNKREGCESVILDLNRGLWVTMVRWVNVCDSDRADKLTLNVWGPSYLSISSISWRRKEPGHQQPWFWLRRIGRFLSYLRKDFNYMRCTNVEK